MAMKFNRWNAPFDKISPFGVGMNAQSSNRPMIAAFCELTWDATAVGPIAGQTYDATNHVTTLVQFALDGFTPFQNWGMRYVHDFYCPDGSSGANVSNVSALKPGKCAIKFNEAGSFFQIFIVGNTGAADNLTPAQYLEADATIAGILAPLRFSGLLIGSE